MRNHVLMPNHALEARTPLAWRSLTHDRGRFFASAAGVAFAVVLMLVELGFLNAIYDSTTLVIDAFDADLVLISRLKDNTNPSKPFPRAKLAQARAIPGVEDAVAVYLSRWATWRTDGAAVRDKVRVLAFDPESSAFDLPEVRAQQDLLKKDDTALVDRRQRDSYGGVLRPGLVGELAGRRMHLLGDFLLGPDLEMNATLLVSERTFRLLFFDPTIGRDPLLDVDFGLVHLEPGARVDAVRRELSTRLGEEILVLAPESLVSRIHRYWTRNKPVGAVFGLGVLVGFVIGVVICYQILFTDVVDHLPQFATLLAIGYSKRYLSGLAVRRGLFLATAASALGVPVGFLAYGVLAEVTGLTFELTAGRAALVVSASVLMCVLASLLAMKKAFYADPADLF